MNTHKPSKVKGVIHHMATGAAITVAADDAVGAGAVAAAVTITVGATVAADDGVGVVATVTVAAGAIAAGAVATVIAACAVGARDCFKRQAQDIGDRAAKWLRRTGTALGITLPLACGVGTGITVKSLIDQGDAHKKKADAAAPVQTDTVTGPAGRDCRLTRAHHNAIAASDSSSTARESLVLIVRQGCEASGPALNR